MTKRESAILRNKIYGPIESQRRRESYYANPNLCLYCSKPIPIKDGKKPSYARRQKFCDHACAARLNNTGSTRNGTPHPRYGAEQRCAVCDKPIHYTLQYCSRKCSAVDRYPRYIAAWKAGTVTGKAGQDGTSAHIVRYIREKFGNKCSRCGWCEKNQRTGIVPVQVHHIDGNHTNMDESNLSLLCPNCHSLTETYGSGNRGRGRDARRMSRRNKNAVITQVAERHVANVKVPESWSGDRSNFAEIAQAGGAPVL